MQITQDMTGIVRRMDALDWGTGFHDFVLPVIDSVLDGSLEGVSESPTLRYMIRHVSSSLRYSRY